MKNTLIHKIVDEIFTLIKNRSNFIYSSMSLKCH
nr:MAG TPA: hypothetical protein [Caudoviricetes sp.]